MANRGNLPEVGCVVEVLRGRDRGAFGVVVSHESDRFVLIVDGDKHKLDKPKRKNVLHVQKTAHVAHEIANVIASQGKLSNAHIRHALRHFLKSRQGVEQDTGEEGLANGER